MENLEAGVHGGLNQAELKALGLTPEAVLDFSVCFDPFMPPPAVKKAFGTVAINRYPDSEAVELRQCLSGKLGVAADNILVGNGAVELIRLIALTYFGSGDSVLVLEPTFGEYKVACRIVGAEVVNQWSGEEGSFTPNIKETLDLIRNLNPKGVFVCNPSNPAGQYLTKQDIEMILDACGDSLLILDEAYIAFVDESWSSLDLISRGNLVIVRSMTKDYALAGLRLGYVIAHKEVISALRRVCPPWNVNVVAQQAGVIALDDSDYFEWAKREVAKVKQYLIDELSRVGFVLIPSSANFFLVKVADAKSFRSALLRYGILVRDCTSFGLSQYVRIAPRSMPECQKFIATILMLKDAGEVW